MLMSRLAVIKFSASVTVSNIRQSIITKIIYNKDKGVPVHT
jgi:hypothetical protein